MVGKVAIIGCGPSGISALAAFDDAKKRGLSVPQVVSFEKQSTPGGLWNLTYKTGVDEYGEPVHGSMYRFLWSNAPKEGIETTKYTFDEHYKQPIASYPPRFIILNYLLGRYNTIENKTVLFNTVVRDVSERGDKFIVTFENLLTTQRESDIFDYVIVATGHYSRPHLPKYSGLENFSGRILHSHDFRNAKEFKNQTVLLIGSSYTAEDVAIQCFKYGCKKCLVSYHKEPTGLSWPDGIFEVPGVSYFDNEKCHFIDGSCQKADVVIFCTGYDHHYPFMDNKLKLRDATNVMYFDHLYKGIFLENNPRVMYIGAQDSCYTFVMFDIQAWYARDYILQKIILPEESKMKEDIKAWLNRRLGLLDGIRTSVLDVANGHIEFQRDYLCNLLEVSYFLSVSGCESGRRWWLEIQ